MSDMFNPCRYTGPEMGFRAPPMPPATCLWCDGEVEDVEPGDPPTCIRCTADARDAARDAYLETLS